MSNGKEKLIHILIVALIIVIFVCAYFILDNMLFSKEKQGEITYKQEITTEEVEKKMEKKGLYKYDISQVLNDTKQNVSYMYFDTSNNYQIVYSNFNKMEDAVSNYNTNLNLLSGKYAELVELTKETKDNYSKYEVENTDNYAVILRIGTSYFQVETSKSNKSSVQNIISELEK